MPKPKEGGVLMEAFYFDFFLLPLIVLVVALGASVYYLARKKQKARKRTKRLMQGYFKEKTKEQELMNREIANLQRLLENKSIDRETYVRLKKVLAVTHEKDRAEVEDLVDYVKNKK
jgi:uncharacterized protein YqgQ